MYLHLGFGTVLNEKDIIGLFDMDKTTITQKGRLYLSNKEKRGKITGALDEIPKSFVLCVEDGEEKIYISQLSTNTLLKRSLPGLNGNI